MTQKEIDKFLANTKVYVNGKSKEIQEKLFELGYSWYGNNPCDVIHTNYPFLYIDNNKLLLYDTDMDYFMEHRNREITAEQILSLKLPKPAYRPFKNQEECWQEMLKHQPFGWLKAKGSTSSVLIGHIYMGKEVWIVGATGDKTSYSASKVFNGYVFADGTPFGIKEE